jgi:hypothetical protein
MTFGPDGALYVSSPGFGSPPGAGEIVKVTVSHACHKCDDAMNLDDDD